MARRMGWVGCGWLACMAAVPVFAGLSVFYHGTTETGAVIDGDKILPYNIGW
jgi:hypothetical protein